MPYGATAAEAEFQGALEGIQAALKKGVRSLAIQVGLVWGHGSYSFSLFLLSESLVSFGVMVWA
jgi:hypothetical protein